MRDRSQMLNESGLYRAARMEARIVFWSCFGAVPSTMAERATSDPLESALVQAPLHEARGPPLAASCKVETKHGEFQKSSQNHPIAECRRETRSRL